MALNINEALEIVKRAGYGSNGRMKPVRSERRMADSQRAFEQEENRAEPEQAEDRMQLRQEDRENLLDIEDL